jgi:hypothetical protein
MIKSNYVNVKGHYWYYFTSVCGVVVVSPKENYHILKGFDLPSNRFFDDELISNEITKRGLDMVDKLVII